MKLLFANLPKETEKHDEETPHLRHCGDGDRNAGFIGVGRRAGCQGQKPAAKRHATQKAKKPKEAVPSTYPADYRAPLAYGRDFVEVTGDGVLRGRYRFWGDWDKEFASYSGRRQGGGQGPRHSLPQGHHGLHLPQERHDHAPERQGRRRQTDDGHLFHAAIVHRRHEEQVHEGILRLHVHLVRRRVGGPVGGRNPGEHALGADRHEHGLGLPAQGSWAIRSSRPWRSTRTAACACGCSAQAGRDQQSPRRHDRQAQEAAGHRRSAVRHLVHGLAALRRPDTGDFPAADRPDGPRVQPPLLGQPPRS